MAKIEMQQVLGNSYFMTGVFAVGVYRYGDKVILIDSGSDDQSAGAVANCLNEQNYKISAIINTHCHADHCGGNYFFQKKDPALRVYAAHDEKFFIEDPKWAPRCFCGNAAPFAGLKNKYLAPQYSSSVTDVVSYRDENLVIDGQIFKIITLPGHTPGSIGILTSDNILYSGDALFGVQTLQKHPILFYTDIGQTLKTFAKLKTLSIKACVLYHGGVISSHALENQNSDMKQNDPFVELVQRHEEKILQTKDAVFNIIQNKQLSLDLLTQQVMQKYGIPGNVTSFTLTQTAIRAYVTLLESEKLVEIMVKDGLLEIKKV